jgi:ATP-binding cassette subfamily C protein LapB
MRRGAPGQSDEQIVAACKLSGAHDFISRLPDGYRTMVGEGGTGVSVGERRKLALAMSFLRKPSVLVLDEPSNDLDFQSERNLLATLLAVAKVRTVVVVTHSLRIVSAATRGLPRHGAGQRRAGHRRRDGAQAVRRQEAAGGGGRSGAGRRRCASQPRLHVRWRDAVVNEE